MTQEKQKLRDLFDMMRPARLGARNPFMLYAVLAEIEAQPGILINDLAARVRLSYSSTQRHVMEMCNAGLADDNKKIVRGVAKLHPTVTAKGQKLIDKLAAKIAPVTP